MRDADVLTCYAVAGLGSLLGLGLILLVRTDQPRIRRALRLYRLAFLCLSSFVAVLFTPEHRLDGVLRQTIGLCAMGATLLAWAFRQLNGQRTPLWLGLGLTLASGLALWVAGATLPMGPFGIVIALVFGAIALGTLLDQGRLLLVHASSRTGGEIALLSVALAFALNWMLILWHVPNWQGPYPVHLLMAPDWLLAPSALGIALLPLSVASVVFAIVNERQHQQLRDRASSDDLTGALSRRGLRERGERLLSDRGEAAGGVAVLMIDVDHFKAINDRHGHLVGDQVLRHVTALLSEHLREDALLARYGGEEFTVVLPVRSHDDALTVAERLRQVVEQQPCEVDGQAIAATVSIGVAFHRPAASLEDALSRADARLYEAKQAGRNRISGEGLPA